MLLGILPELIIVGGGGGELRQADKKTWCFFFFGGWFVRDNPRCILVEGSFVLWGGIFGGKPTKKTMCFVCVCVLFFGGG